MTQPLFDLVPLWTVILGLGIFFYVLLDGFDLGVGILYGFAPDRDARNIVMNSIAPIWDGNETWLVLGGVGLLAAFPLAFAIIIPALYFPILVMLLALVFRGVAFEFRYKDAQHRTFWDYAFCYGSTVAVFAQGVMLGAFIHGFQTDGRVFSGGSLDCFSAFSIFTGIALLFGYGLLGAGWLVLKTEAELQDWARRHGRWCFFWGHCRHRDRQPMDAMPRNANRAALVFLAEYRLPCARSNHHALAGAMGVALAQ
jgi:cytochrome bd ubiquinol oxidase subunit II